MHIQTVNGPISPESLGVTLSHEHIILDYRCAWSPPPPTLAFLAEAKVTPELAGVIRENAHHSLDNLILNDEETAIEELMAFKRMGGNAIVEHTTFGLSPDPLKLRDISRRTGLHIIMGAGYYRYISHDSSILELKSDQMAEEIVKSFEAGIGQTDVCAGIIGEIGTSFPLHPFEKESLIAAAKAQQQTGAAISVHPEVFGYGHLDLLDILESAGADLNRTTMCHMDELVDMEWHRKIAKRGVYISFDTFGSEFIIDRITEPADANRVNCLIALLEAGFADSILISHDVCYKIQLQKYCGYGYNHILSNIVPLLKKRGVAGSEVSKMLIENPARFLAI